MNKKAYPMRVSGVLLSYDLVLEGRFPEDEGASFTVFRGHQAILEREHQKFLLHMEIEAVRAVAEQIVGLNHHEEAVANMIASNLQLEKSGVKIEKICYLVLVLKEDRSERAAREGPLRPEDEGTEGEKAGSPERADLDDPLRAGGNEGEKAGSPGRADREDRGIGGGEGDNEGGEGGEGGAGGGEGDGGEGGDEDGEGGDEGGTGEGAL